MPASSIFDPLGRRAARAPGRITIIGDHTDYTGGLSLPMAIDRHVEIEGTTDTEPYVRLASDHEEEDAVVRLDVEDPRAEEPAWARYVAAVVAELRPERGFAGVVRSTLPIGVGLSSSAALEVAVALALGADLDDRIALARLCQRAEHKARGLPTGILDQIASLCGVEGHGLLLDCHATTATPVELPPDDEVEWVVLRPTTEPRSLDESGYSDRVRELAEVEEIVGPLRLSPTLGAIDDPILRKRAKHVLSENARVRDFVGAIASDDLAGAGELMNDSHDSLRADFESSTTDIDKLWKELRTTRGVFGARITGGGWGGCLIALTRPGRVEGVNALVVRPSAGASVDRFE